MPNGEVTYLPRTMYYRDLGEIATAASYANDVVIPIDIPGSGGWRAGTMAAHHRELEDTVPAGVQELCVPRWSRDEQLRDQPDRFYALRMRPEELNHVLNAGDRLTLVGYCAFWAGKQAARRSNARDEQAWQQAQERLQSATMAAVDRLIGSGGVRANEAYKQFEIDSALAAQNYQAAAMLVGDEEARAQRADRAMANASETVLQAYRNGELRIRLDPDVARELATHTYRTRYLVGQCTRRLNVAPEDQIPRIRAEREWIKIWAAKERAQLLARAVSLRPEDLGSVRDFTALRPYLARASASAAVS